MCNVISICLKPVPGIQIVGISRLRLRQWRILPSSQQKKSKHNKKNIVQGTSPRKKKSCGGSGREKK